MPLELFSDCFRNVNFPVFLLKTIIPSETEEGPDIFKLHEAAMSLVPCLLLDVTFKPVHRDTLI